ncbi:hypothetical protein SAMN05192573_104528 [Mucilaginibacter gossypii]|uniref:Uncharacterized protein n=1 Tax=Mucilaginibacter gossypii TaxID=551996 RepID=A0A1G7WS07_9SPHI|nr:hypothetical protein SAMN05192573_104528 [Mucilaginibacter gossypii]
MLHNFPYSISRFLFTLSQQLTTSLISFYYIGLTILNINLTIGIILMVTFIR